MDNLEINPENLQGESEVAEKKERHRHSLASFIPMLIVIIFLASFFGAVFGFMAGGFGQKVFTEISHKFPKVFQSSGNYVNSDPAVSREKIIEEDSAVIDVVEKSTPAVVSIVISKDVPKIQSFFDPFGFFGDPNSSGNAPDQNSTPNNSGGNMQKQKIGAGTGFIITSDGMIVTNKHVVADSAADYTVLTNDGKEHPAKVLARDPINDIAVIKIDGTNYSTLSFGDSNSLKIGQTAIAIGNSLGEFSNTVSKGIISGLKRNLTAGGGLGDSEKLTNIIQTDAAINPGNSGGPLLDISGKVIGINVAIAQGAQNVGFALPASQVQKITDQVKTTGKISTPYLGVRYIPVDDALQKQIKLPFNYGVMILRGQTMTDFAVIPGSPADKAGLVENDVILEVNGQKVDANNSLVDLLSKFNVGDEVTLKVWHKGDTKNVTVKLEERAQ
ncbi:MAG: trypsin-like peptidase domain-containing protein [Candidatus Moranbacteria bacterium]|nr:trypsin-like peptidase domain-containing protein [Candidatus Moranbacteria bacterium]